MTRKKFIWGLAVPMFIGGIYSCSSSGDNGSSIGEGSGDVPIGGSCTTNGDCASGLCENDVCVGQTAGGSCTENSLCASGLCLNGSCATGAPGGSTCMTDTDCVSRVCTDGMCVGNGTGAPSGSSCTTNSDCASGMCASGTCASGTNLPDGSSCTSDTECASGSCTGGICGTGTGGGTGGSGGGDNVTGGAGGADASAGSGGIGTGGAATGGGTSTGGASAGTGGITGGGDPPGTPCTSDTECASGACLNGECLATTTGPQWGGSGVAFRPLVAGCGPDTADECTGTCEAAGGDPNVDIIRPPATLCFGGTGDETPDDPAVVIEQSIETVNGQTYVHIRVTFDPAFVDNTYGEPVCCGWNPNRPHTFNKDLTGSDHTELLLTNADGTTVMNFKIDYITADPSASCGYSTLGVTGGDGSVIQGDASAILAVATSLDRNINGCGYCTSDACGASHDCTIDSPTTDANYTVNPLTPDWDYRQVYEVWIDYDAFGTSGFGQAYITYVHASPNKSAVTTINVTPEECPPTWDTPYCPPDIIQEGGNCFGSPTPGTGGTGGDGGISTGGTAGSGGSGGTSGGCPVNYQIYITTEGASTCTPIPFANWPNMAACPDGYHLDLLTEGQYCLPN